MRKKALRSQPPPPEVLCSLDTNPDIFETAYFLTGFTSLWRVARSRLQDSGEKSFSKKKCEKREGAATAHFPKSRASYFRFARFNTSPLSLSLAQAIWRVVPYRYGSGEHIASFRMFKNRKFYLIWSPFLPPSPLLFPIHQTLQQISHFYFHI